MAEPKPLLECGVFWRVYDPAEATRSGEPAVAFEDLPADWRCPECDSPRQKFLRRHDGPEAIGDRIGAIGADKLTGFHAAFSNGGVGSNIQAKRYRCAGFGGCQAKRSRNSPLRTAARTCNIRCAPLSVHCICCFLTIRRATRESTADSVDTAFEQIRHYSKSDMAVSLRLIRAFDDIAVVDLPPREQQSSVRRVRRVADGCGENLPEADLLKLRERLTRWNCA